MTVDELVGNVEAETGAQTEENQENHERYYELVAIRGIAAALLGVANLMIAYSFTIPFDLIALLVGIWVRHPAVWVSAVVLLAINIVMGVMALLVDGNVLALASVLVCALCARRLNCPQIRARFHIRKEDKQ